MNDVSIRRDDEEPLWQHQVERDDSTVLRTKACDDPRCDIKMQPHSHRVRQRALPPSDPFEILLMFTGESESGCECEAHRR